MKKHQIITQISDLYIPAVPGKIKSVDPILEFLQVSAEKKRGLKMKNTGSEKKCPMQRMQIKNKLKYCEMIDTKYDLK